jgi:hypothetical protein
VADGEGVRSVEREHVRLQVGPGLEGGLHLRLAPRAERSSQPGWFTEAVGRRSEYSNVSH